MFVEAIRSYIVTLGATEAANWNDEAVMKHMDMVLLSCLQEHPEHFSEILDTMWKHLRTNLMTLNNVLSKDLPQ